MDLLLSFGLCALMAAAGDAFMAACRVHDSGSRLGWRLGSGFFTGFALSVTGLRLLTALGVPASAAANLVSASLLAAAAFHARKALPWQQLPRRHILLGLGGAGLTAALLLLYWLPNPDLQSSTFTFGSLHAERGAALVRYIHNHDSVPVLGQNTGQALAAFQGAALGVGSPYAALFALLVASVLAYGYAIHAVLAERLAPGIAAIGAAAALLGNSALSTQHVLLIDSGSPFALSGYADSLFAAFLPLALLALLASSAGAWARAAALTVLLSAAALSAPQDLLLLAACLPLAWLMHRPARPGYPTLAPWAAAFALAGAIALTQGGMLTPSAWQDHPDIPGMMTIEAGQPGAPAAALDLGLPAYVGMLDCWSVAGAGAPAEPLPPEPKHWALFSQQASRDAWAAESMAMDALRKLFFPILGLLWLGWAKPAGSRARARSTLPPPRVLAACGAYLLAVGSCTEFLLAFHGYKWQLSRLLLPGLSLGMLALPLAAGGWAQNKARPHIWMAALALLMTFGPLVSAASAIVKHAGNGPSEAPLSLRLEAFFADTRAETILPPRPPQTRP